MSDFWADVAYSWYSRHDGYPGEPHFVPNLTYTGHVLWVAWGAITGWMGPSVLYCRWFGHDLVDGGSFYGPDSGTECLECRRCGWSWSHTYY